MLHLISYVMRIVVNCFCIGLMRVRFFLHDIIDMIRDEITNILILMTVEKGLLYCHGCMLWVILPWFSCSKQITLRAWILATIYEAKSTAKKSPRNVFLLYWMWAKYFLFHIFLVGCPSAFLLVCCIRTNAHCFQNCRVSKNFKRNSPESRGLETTLLLLCPVKTGHLLGSSKSCGHTS